MRAEILALVEPGPQSADHLAAWLDRPKKDVLRQCYALEREGALKRTGVQKLWALSSHQGKVGRPAGVNVNPHDDEIYAALESGPRPSSALTHVLHLSEASVHRALRRLEARGEVKRIGAGRGRFTTWARSTWQPPPRPDVQPPPSSDVPVRERRAQPRRPEAPPLRQPKASTAVTKDQAPSWWVGLPRAGFQQTAEGQVERMRGSKEARFVPGTMSS